MASKYILLKNENIIPFLFKIIQHGTPLKVDNNIVPQKTAFEADIH